MDQEFRFTDFAYCKLHPKRPISSLYYKKDCKYKSRLACSKCILEYKVSEGFMDIVDVLNNPRVLLNENVQPKGNYDLLNRYFSFLEQDAEEVSYLFNNEFIHSLKEDINKQIEKLLNDLKEAIERCNQFKAEIKKVKVQFNEALGCEKFRQTFKDILKVENYHESEEWKKFEEKVQSFVLQFEDQNNQEVNEAYYKLTQMQLIFFNQQILNDFKISMSKSVELMCLKLTKMELFQEFTSLCDNLFQSQLITKIQNKKGGCPKLTLLFKGSAHGLNGQTFWEKCSDKGPTIVICKSKSGYVFGGYTPCKWLPNGSWQKDESKTSFVFSYTRKEIYPITTGDNAILCNSSYGPIFGNGHQFYINLNFQDGSSNMDGKSYSSESYKIESPSTHLMGGVKPELVEMEVFLVE